MRFALLALGLFVSGCGSTQTTPPGPCPERVEPVLGSMCSIEGTQCEYVLSGSCQMDEFLCTSGKWTMADAPADAGDCRPFTPREDAGDAAADAAADGAADAPMD